MLIYKTHDLGHMIVSIIFEKTTILNLKKLIIKR
jgi:hypothetical protein